jgi:hypothetical protein
MPTPDFPNSIRRRKNPTDEFFGRGIGPSIVGHRMLGGDDMTAHQYDFTDRPNNPGFACFRFDEAYDA